MYKKFIEYLAFHKTKNRRWYRCKLVVNFVQIYSVSADMISNLREYEVRITVFAFNSEDIIVSTS